ncbi:MAG: hypothetical protein VKI42_05545 [Synechococcaceae cyanobacterium]|nr:hypothetical protein [Synechococcaceae cyanobacterium]
MEPEPVRQLGLFAHQQGNTPSACLREPIQQDLPRHGDREEPRRPSEPQAQLEPPSWSEQVSGWSDCSA